MISSNVYVFILSSPHSFSNSFSLCVRHQQEFGATVRALNSIHSFIHSASPLTILGGGFNVLPACRMQKDININLACPQFECELSTILLHLNTWLQSSGTVWEGCGAFKWSLVGASESLRQTLRISVPSLPDVDEM